VWNPGGGGILSAHSSAGKAEVRQQAANDLLNDLPSQFVEQLKKKKQMTKIRVEVKQMGNSWIICSVRA